MEELGSSNSEAVREALSGYELARSSYRKRLYADVCLKAYHTVYNILKAYARERDREAIISGDDLVSIAIDLGISDPEILQELSRLSFILVYVKYPELKIYGDVEFHGSLARKCLRAIRVVALKLLNLNLPSNQLT